MDKLNLIITTVQDFDSSFYNDEILGEYFYIRSFDGTVWPTMKFEKEFEADPEMALDLSIKKWEFIVDVIEHYHDLQEGVFPYCNDCDSCALCMRHRGCEGCPVKEDGNFGCSGTPWSFYRHSEDQEMALGFAKKEVTYLKSLSTKGE